MQLEFAQDKYEALLVRLHELESVLVAYSGGVDSTLLAVCAHAILGDRCIAVLATSDTYPASEAEYARSLAAELGLHLIEVETTELADPHFTANQPDRCYHCKSELFGLLTRVADCRGLAHICDGSNADDVNDHRPGRQAARESKVVSPLEECGLTKQEIRAIAKDLGLPNWDKPSMACLASRFPYGQPITDAALMRVAQAEDALRAMGLRQFRVRSHGDIARVEISGPEMDVAWSMRARISEAMRGAGFAYAAQDLDGYRTGSLNEILAAD